LSGGAARLALPYPPAGEWAHPARPWLTPFAAKKQKRPSIKRRVKNISEKQKGRLLVPVRSVTLQEGIYIDDFDKFNSGQF